MNRSANNLFHNLTLDQLQSFRWMKEGLMNPNVKVEGEAFLESSIRPMLDSVLVGGAGAVCYTSTGQDIIDMCSMTVNCILGQNDPWVKLNQLAYLLSDKPSYHSSKLGCEIYYEIPALLGKAKIGGIKNPQINHKQCNGSDIVEMAIRVAYAKKDNRKFLASFKGSYHGQNLTAYLISDVQRVHTFLDGWNNNVIFLNAPPNEQVWSTPISLIDRPLNQEEEYIVDHLISIAPTVYGIILEPIQGHNYLTMFSLPLVRKIREIATQHNICLIFDEVQTGFGWLGKLSAAEVYGVAPDILLLSKALTSGNGPLGVTVFGDGYKDIAPAGSTEKTNGADVRSLVAAKAVFERLSGVPASEIPSFINEPLRTDLAAGLLKDYPKKAALLDNYLDALVCDYPHIIEKKLGMGLMRGIQIKSNHKLSAADIGRTILEQTLLKGALLRRAHDMLIIRPPLVISENEMTEGINRLRSVLDHLKTDNIHFI